MSDVNIPEPGQIVLATAAVRLAMVEKATVEGTAVFADAWTAEAAEKRLKEYLEEQLLADGILAEATVSIDVSQEAEDFDTSKDEDATFDTDSDPGDETDNGECCGECEKCPVYPSEEDEDEDANYITLRLTPAEAAAVRVATGNLSSTGDLAAANATVYEALRVLVAGENLIEASLDAYDYRMSAEPRSNAAFAKIICAYEQALHPQTVTAQFHYAGDGHTPRANGVLM